jgi:hypothetical protein
MLHKVTFVDSATLTITDPFQGNTLTEGSYALVSPILIPASVHKLASKYLTATCRSGTPTPYEQVTIAATLVKPNYDVELVIWEAFSGMCIVRK